MSFVQKKKKRKLVRMYVCKCCIRGVENRTKLDGMGITIHVPSELRSQLSLILFLMAGCDAFYYGNNIPFKSLQSHWTQQKVLKWCVFCKMLLYSRYFISFLNKIFYELVIFFWPYLPAQQCFYSVLKTATFSPDECAVLHNFSVKPHA